MKINNINVSACEFQNSLRVLKGILLYNEQGVETTWPVVSCDGWEVYLSYNVGEDLYGYKEETRLSDNSSATCGYGAGSFWTSYPEE